MVNDEEGRLEAVMSEIKDAGPRIVAGVDGSASAREALRWAIRQAELTSASVDAVTAWEYPAAYGGYGMAPVGVADDVDFAGFAEKTVTEEVAAAAGPDSPVAVRTQVAEGSPAGVLLAAAEGADLLVVGSRGHGGFAEALLGSVGQHCVHHARCPVVVVRAG
jgi:nucleotide-binding universal stress UspA family protein